MMPPGLSFVAVNGARCAAAERNPTPRFYWDWLRRASPISYRKFCGTPPQSLLCRARGRARADLRRRLEERVIARHRRIADAVQAAVQCWSEAGALRFFGRDPVARSVSVTAVQVGPGIDPEALRSVARERFQVAMAGGLGPLAGRVFRIGHLGDTNAAMILGCLGGVEAAMRVQGIPFDAGGVERAVEVLAAV